MCYYLVLLVGLLKGLGQKQMYKPIKVYSIASSISTILSRPGTLQACESWRNRDIFPGFYGDIYNGRVWQQFHNTVFFSQPYSYGLLLNVNWFEPFEHSVYAVGVVFMSLLNRPRHVRYNQENVILCGLIPGPKEPSLNVNSFLEPLIEDLLLLWRGKEVDLPSGTIRMRAALICIFCDSPAMRKVGGFVSHNAGVINVQNRFRQHHLERNLTIVALIGIIGPLEIIAILLKLQ